MAGHTHRIGFTQASNAGRIEIKVDALGHADTLVVQGVAFPLPGNQGAHASVLWLDADEDDEAALRLLGLVCWRGFRVSADYSVPFPSNVPPMEGR